MNGSESLRAVLYFIPSCRRFPREPKGTNEVRTSGAIRSSPGRTDIRWYIGNALFFFNQRISNIKSWNFH